MIDAAGLTRWYWQHDSLGVRMAVLTPHNTILALLCPRSKGEFNPQKKEDSNNINYTVKNRFLLRSSKLGFAGGTELVEINLEGKIIWRQNLISKNIIIHHDFFMNQHHEITAIYRTFKLYDLDKDKKMDTLWGDGIIVIDSMGKITKKWDVWDINQDKKLKQFAYDRFHFNAICLDKQGNYLLSTPIENQIWKVDARQGNVIWKLGDKGDFKINKEDVFYFQHNVQTDEDGNITIFDNGDYLPDAPEIIDPEKSKIKQSRTLVFKLDTISMRVTVILKTLLPVEYYTSRMGASFIMKTGDIIQTSSKTGNILVTDNKGKVKWKISLPFVLYRAKYIPQSTWSNYIVK